MHRQQLINLTRPFVIVNRGFVSGPAVNALPSMKQPHTIEKPEKNEDHDPQTESMNKSREEKKTADQEPKKKKETEGPSAGIGMQV
jgi:hypothetical protein